MLNFNLLPSQGKKELKTKEISFSVNKFLRTIFLVFIVFLVLLSTIYFYLDTLVKSQNDLIEKRRESSLFKEFQKLEQKITKINSKINKIYGIQKEAIYFSPIIEEIARIISSVEGVYLNSVEILPEIETITPEQPLPDAAESQQPESQSEEKTPETPQVIQKEYLKVSITGFAKKREQILDIKEKLESSSYFKDVVSPIENIISPTNINFIFDFRVKQ